MVAWTKKGLGSEHGSLNYEEGYTWKPELRRGLHIKA